MEIEREILLEENKTKNVSFTLDSEIYSELKKIVAKGKLSSFANSLFKEYLKEERRKKLESDYIAFQNSKDSRDVAKEVKKVFDYSNDDRW